MKILFTFIFVIIVSCGFSQTDDFNQLLEKGKAEFKKEDDKQDFFVAAEALQKAVALKPENTEAHYFLGCAYSRTNSKDANMLLKMTAEMTIKVSEQFEAIIKLTPEYKGEIIILDPYSKLNSEWSSLAMKYWYYNKTDSMQWAYNESKKRGGFSEFLVSQSRAKLDICDKNAILISSGDNATFPLFYVQQIEGYRKDVSLIDISLLNTEWYARVLAGKGVISFDNKRKYVDTIQYCEWKDSLITIENFSWTVKPSYYDLYLGRSDILFMSILRDNKFKRSIYFTTAFNESMRLSLKDYLISLTMLDKLNINKEPELSTPKFKTEILKFLPSIKQVNKFSPDEMSFIDDIRYAVFYKIYNVMNDDKTSAKDLLMMLDMYTDEKTYPIQVKSVKEFSDYIHKSL